MGSACKIYVLNLQVVLLSSAAGGDVATARDETASLDHLFQCGQNVLVCFFSRSTMLGASVRVVAVPHTIPGLCEIYYQFLISDGLYRLTRSIVPLGRCEFVSF